MTPSLRLARRARRSVSAVAGVALVSGLGLALTAPVASASPTPSDQVCDGLDSGKEDTEGDPQTVEVDAPEGSLISGYCVKAGSALQGDGPVYVEVDPPAASVLIEAPSGKAVSHYSLSYVPEPTASGSPTPTPSGSGEPSGTPTVSEEPSEEPSETTSATPTGSGTPSEVPSGPVTPTESVTVSPTASDGATPTGPAAACPGLGEDEDYRALFDYQYLAGNDEDGWVVLGQTGDWDDEVFVQYLNGYAADPIEDMMVRAVVTLGSGVDIGAGCAYDFSLASYEAQGPTFSTSGQQVFLDHDTDTITEGTTSVTLQVLPAECYGQSDLYTGDDVYDGDRTPSGPGYAPITADGNMIANWGGGYGCDEATATPSDSLSPGTVVPSESVTDSVSPGATDVPSESVSASETVGAAATTTTTAGSVAGASTAAVAGGSTTPAVLGAAQRPASALARTGIETWTVALVAGVLLVAGGAMTALAQGSSRSRRH